MLSPMSPRAMRVTAGSAEFRALWLGDMEDSALGAMSDTALILIPVYRAAKRLRHRERRVLPSRV